MDIIYEPIVENGEIIDYGIELCANDYGQECGYACMGADQ